jgi:hypothetical protein
MNPGPSCAQVSDVDGLANVKSCSGNLKRNYESGIKEKSIDECSGREWPGVHVQNYLSSQRYRQARTATEGLGSNAPPF